MPKDGEVQKVTESVLAHSPRAVVFLDSDTICFAYSATEYCVFSINQGFVVGTDGKQTKPATIDWPSPPDKVGQHFYLPYIFSILPPGTVPRPENGGTSTSSGSALAAPQSSLIPSPVVQIISSLTMQPVQTLPFPLTPLVSLGATCTFRLLTSSPTVFFLVATPNDRTVAAAEGSSIWQFQMKSWGDQIDELVQRGLYSDALSLVDTLDTDLLPHKVCFHLYI
ncbi:hypothetical protein AZE42_11959 [Rhizopogon vesiculosus]|uniref:CNH domain-containing protein n=1 Tax=Rhizopogon vesiculosus TaxID=180088 RepID=A0A1J8QBE5_9AGAM|nr:hypothetical protein AZE42_11959 [Rhizopogon vesiculosus]